jgi:hypothetical protein
MMFRALVLAALWVGHGELRAEQLPEAAGFAPKLIIYLARGTANSCGPGCDHWIAVEGTVDQAAASRVSRFLRDVKDTRRPIYFNSPGGSVEPAYAIGRLLRGRKAVARVGRTIVAACAAGTQVDDACLKIKNAGGEVEAEISTYHAMCNSACGYLFLGATTREVAPDAAVAVHNSRLTLVVRGHPPPQALAAFRERSLAKADRDRASFIAAMGISHELDALIEIVAQRGSGCVFALTGPRRHVLLATSEGQAGVVAANLKECLELVVAHPYWHDILRFGGGDLSAMREVLRDRIEDFEEDALGGDPEIEEFRPQLRARLGLAEPDDPLKLLHHAITVLGADVVRGHDGYPSEPLAGRFKWP